MERLTFLICVVMGGMCRVLAAPVENIPACSQGEFWSNGTCQMCTVCGSNMEVSRMCAETEDTVCRCPRGSFFETLDDRCQKCRDCPKGSQVTRACSAVSDTQCSPCPDGHFYEPNQNLCQTCSQCVSDEVPLRPCGAIFDTVCIGKSVMYGPDHWNLVPRTADMPTKRQAKSSGIAAPQKSLIVSDWKKDFSPNPFYFLALALVIFVVACNAIVQTCRSYECSFPCPKCFTEYSPAVPTTEAVPPTTANLLQQQQQQQQQPLLRSQINSALPGSQLRSYCPGLPLQQLSLPLTNGSDQQQPTNGERSRLCSTSTAFRSQLTHTTVLPV